MKSVLLVTAMVMSSLPAFAKEKVLSVKVEGVQYKYSAKGFTDRAAARKFCKDLKMKLVAGEEAMDVAFGAAAEEKQDLVNAMTYKVFYKGEVDESGLIGWVTDADSAQYDGADVFTIRDGGGFSSQVFKIKDANKELKSHGVAELSVRAVCK